MAPPKGKRFGGRQRGTPNKLTSDARTMIRDALDKLGGVDWLVAQAKKKPEAFMALFGRTVPRDVQGEITANVKGNIRFVCVTGIPKEPLEQAPEPSGPRVG